MVWTNITAGSTRNARNSRLRACQRCGGALANDYEDMCCVNCGATHDRYGRLLAHRAISIEQPKELEMAGE